MMTPKRVLAALLAFLWVVTLGCSGGTSEQKKTSVTGRMAEKLDRLTALALLKEKEDDLLKPLPPGFSGMPSSWYLAPVELEATVSRPIPGGFGGGTPEEEEARDIANMRGELAVRNALVDVGLLKRQADKDIQETITYDGRYEKRTRYAYYFSVVAQPGVAFTPATPGCRNTAEKRLFVTSGECRGNASFALAKAAFTSVTGVLQQGIEAEVEAQVTYSPSTLYEALLAAEQKMQEKLGPGDLSITFRRAYWDSLHNTQVSGTETRQYQFRKYDDGWRLVR